MLKSLENQLDKDMSLIDDDILDDISNPMIVQLNMNHLYKVVKKLHFSNESLHIIKTDEKAVLFDVSIHNFYLADYNYQNLSYDIDVGDKTKVA